MRCFNSFLVFFILFFVSCSNPKDVIIDSFEGELNSKTVDFGSSEGSSVVVSADKNIKVCGMQSLKVSYDLAFTGYMWVARGYGLDVEGAAKWNFRPEEIKWRRYNAISLYMYGNASGGVIAFDLKDNGGELWRFLLDDDFTGWKEIVCPFSEFFPRSDWQPDSADKNEVLDFPVKSFQFEPRIYKDNTYYFDSVKVTRIKNSK